LDPGEYQCDRRGDPRLPGTPPRQAQATERDLARKRPLRALVQADVTDRPVLPHASSPAAPELAPANAHVAQRFAGLVATAGEASSGFLRSVSCNHVSHCSQPPIARLAPGGSGV